MKRKAFFRMVMSIIFVLMCVCLTGGCSEKEEDQVSDLILEENQKTLTENGKIETPDISQIRAICELATLECYYHNVAISTKEKGTGLMHIGEKDRQFWIEYSGTARLGINMSRVDMKTEGTKIEITIPKAELLALTDCVFEEENYISEEDGFNKNPITADNQTEAVAVAQEEVRLKFANDQDLLAQAQERARKLIENYINQLGELTGTDYQIQWVYEANEPEGDVSEENTGEQGEGNEAEKES